MSDLEEDKEGLLLSLMGNTNRDSQTLNDRIRIVPIEWWVNSLKKLDRYQYGYIHE